MTEINTLISRCLTYGVVILPYAQACTFRMYDKYKIPDDKLIKLRPTDLEKYVRGLYLCGQEMAGDWTEGHKLLKELGFIEKSRQQGHREFLSLEFPTEEITL